MKRMGILFAALGVFLIVDAIAYVIHSGDYDGVTLILATAGGALLVGSYLLQGLHRARAALVEHPEGVFDDEPHVEPTIWPLVFALSMIGLVVGAVTSPWVLLVGGVVLVVALVGWALDIRRQWQHHAAHHGPPLPQGAHDEAG
jgi:hypothetical protein